MLIKVFGIWLIASNINFLEDNGTNCRLYFNSGTSRTQVLIDNNSCDEVAKKINEQVYLLKH